VIDFVTDVFKRVGENVKTFCGCPVNGRAVEVLERYTERV